MTSRPNDENIFQSFGKASQITIAAPESDLRQYITERIEERRDLVNRLTPELKDRFRLSFPPGRLACTSFTASVPDLLDQFTLSRFLLAALQMDRISATSIVKGIKSALTSMPVSWITHARRPLLVGELRHGLAVEYCDDGEGLQEFDEDNLPSPGSLVDVCAGLVIIDSTSQIIRLVHYTTNNTLTTLVCTSLKVLKLLCPELVSHMFLVLGTQSLGS